MEASNANHRAQLLSKHNARLREELASLRAHPDVTPSPESLKVQELTLALRRLSDKLDFTEAALSEKTLECINVHSDATKANHSADAALALAAKLQAQDQEKHLSNMELERKLYVAQVEQNQSDLVISEYASLVRSLEGRLSRSITSGTQEENPTASPGISDTHEDENSDVSKDPFQKFALRIGDLELENGALHERITFLEVELEAERKRSMEDRDLRVASQQALHQLQSDNNAAAKMVSRYMYALFLFGPQFIINSSSGSSLKLHLTAFILQWKT